MKLKICGLQNAYEAAMAVEEGVDAVGLVFADSPRQVDVETAQKITSRIPPFVSRVGVFVDEDPDKVLKIARWCNLDTLQFHGRETPEYCRKFGGYVLVKSFAATDELELAQVKKYPVDAVLLDSSYPDKKGGGGVTFDWNIARPFGKLSLPLILAGGINTANIKDAILSVNPYAVDVSSGAEKNGVKSRELIRILVREVNKIKFAGATTTCSGKDEKIWK